MASSTSNLSDLVVHVRYAVAHILRRPPFDRSGAIWLRPTLEPLGLADMSSPTVGGSSCDKANAAAVIVSTGCRQDK